MQVLDTPALEVMRRAADACAPTLRRDLGEIQALLTSVRGTVSFAQAAARRTRTRLADAIAFDRPADSLLLAAAGGERPVMLDPLREASHDPRQYTPNRCWLIQAIDGEQNFSRAQPNFALVIALLEDGRPAAALVQDPVSDERFTAVHARGAFRNNTRIRLIQPPEPNRAVVAFGTSEPPRAEPLDASLNLRRQGTDALSLAWVAAGRLDGYSGASLSPAAAAAGFLLVREAGGFATDREGNEPDFAAALEAPSALVPELFAGSEAIHRALLAGT